MRVVWVCDYPIDQIKNVSVSVRHKKVHPTPWLITLSRALADETDVELHIVAVSQYISRSFEAKDCGIHFHFVRNAVPFTQRRCPFKISLDLFLNYAFTRRKIIKTIKRISPDVVHAHGTEYVNGFAAIKSGFPVLLSIQGLSRHFLKGQEHRWDVKKRIALETFVLKHVKYFLCKTPFSEKMVRELNPDAECFHIENIMRSEFFLTNVNYELSVRRVLFIGTFNEKKGVPELFAALSLISGVTLVVVGSDGRTALACELVEKYPNLNVEWAGTLTAFEISKQMERVDMLVLPTHADTSPNVVSEAMCAGLPVVGTQVGGLPDMVADKETGILVPVGDSVSLGKAISVLLNDASLRRRFGEVGRESALKRFSPEAVVPKVYQAYQMIIQESAGIR